MTQVLQHKSAVGRVVALSAAVFVLGLGVAAPAASAHGGPIKIEVVAPAPDAAPIVGTATPFEVAINFIEDGDPIDEGTVTAVAEGPAGERVGPVPMEPTATLGHFGGEITFTAAGPWTLRISSVEPDGSLEQQVTVAAGATGATTTIAGATSVAPTTTVVTTESSVVATTTDPGKVEDTTGDGAADDAASDDSGGLSTAVVIGLIAAAAAIIAGVVFGVRKSGKGESGTPEGTVDPEDPIS